MFNLKIRLPLGSQHCQNSSEKTENVIFLPPPEAAEQNLNTSGYNKQARKCTTIGTGLHPDPIFMTELESP